MIFALLMREVLTRFGRHNIGFLWLFVEPMMFTIGVTVLWTLLRATHGSDLPVTVFALTGYSCVLLWRNMPARTVGAVVPNRALMFHRNVRLLDIFLARLFLEVAGTTMSFFILSLFFIGLEWIQPPEDIFQVVVGWAALAWFGIALGLFMGALAEKSELVDKLWHPFSYLLFPLSGAVFLVDALPPQMQKIVIWIPMVNCVEYIREGYFGSHFKPHYDMAYVLGFSLILTLFALAQIRDVATKVGPG